MSTGAQKGVEMLISNQELLFPLPYLGSMLLEVRSLD